MIDVYKRQGLSCISCLENNGIIPRAGASVIDLAEAPACLCIFCRLHVAAVCDGASSWPALPDKMHRRNRYTILKVSYKFRRISELWFDLVDYPSICHYNKKHVKFRISALGQMRSRIYLLRRIYTVSYTHLDISASGGNSRFVRA